MVFLPLLGAILSGFFGKIIGVRNSEIITSFFVTISAILLTFRERVGVKKQSYLNQISRNPSNAVELIEVKSNQGVKVDD